MLHHSFSAAAQAGLDGNNTSDGQATLARAKAAGGSQRTTPATKTSETRQRVLAAAGGANVGDACGLWARDSSCATKYASAKPSTSAAESWRRSWLWNCNSGSRSEKAITSSQPVRRAAHKPIA